MRTKRDSAVSALSYLDNAIDSLQMVQYTEKELAVLTTIITVQKIILGLAESIRERVGMKDDGAVIYLPASKHKPQGSNIAYRHIR